MVDFRKWILALAAVVLVLGAASSASAQQQGVSCVTSATPKAVRAEGLTELVGDVVLTCTNTNLTVPSTAQTLNFTVNLNGGTVPITNREFNGNGNGAGIDALLVLNDAIPTTTNTCLIGSTSTGCPVVQGQLVVSGSLYSVVFSNVAIPALAVSGTAGSTITIRITNIRADANSLGLGPNGSSVPVFELISISGGNLPLTLYNPTVALVQRGLGNVSVISGSTLLQTCVTPPSSFNAFTINFSELYPAVLLTQYPLNTAVTPPTQNSGNSTSYNIGQSESGFITNVISNGLGQVAGAADSGTEVAVVVTGAPANLTLYFPLTVVGTGGTVLTLETGEHTFIPALPNGPAGYAAATPPAFYEVTSQNANSNNIQETFSIPVLGSVIGALVVTPPGAPIPSVNVTLAPRSTDAAPSTSDFVPRFVDETLNTPGFPATPLTVTSCQTTLLFPYVTSAAGFNTGFSVANTSTDPFGTVAQPGGTCTVYLYGLPSTSVPATPPTLSVPTGGVGVALLSDMAANFTGYMFVTCPFQYAHGFSFITNGFNGIGAIDGVGTLSEGYLALVVNRGTASTPVYQPAPGEGFLE